MPTFDESAYHELCAYTLAHTHPVFLHQYVVDAYTIQHSGPNTKPIAQTFALLGLYLCVEKGISGKQVQRFHMQLARTRRDWPRFPLPTQPSAVTAIDVMAAEPGPARDAMILTWAAAVWDICAAAHAEVRAFVQTELGITMQRTDAPSALK